MQTVSITVPMNAEGAKALTQLAAMLAQTATVAKGPAQPVAAVADETPPPKKRGRKPKAQAATQDEDDLNFGDADEAEGDELGLDEPAYTLEGDIIPAFRKFIERHNGDKAKAGKILEAHGVKSVRDLPAEKFGEVMAALSK